MQSMRAPPTASMRNSTRRAQLKVKTALCAAGLLMFISLLQLQDKQTAFIPLRHKKELSTHSIESPLVQHRRAASLAVLMPALTAAAGSSVYAGEPEAKKKWLRLSPIQYIAALGDPQASSGTGAQDWGLWRKDPGPRGVPLSNINKLTAAGGLARAGWKFDGSDWYVEEHGLIMEKPTGGDGGSGEQLKPGKYIVTGDRQVTTVLTVSAPDVDGNSRWQLDEGKLFDVTHLPCRTGRYSGPECSPAKARLSDFPVKPGGLMPPVEGCKKQDYAVLFVIGVEA